MHLEWSLLELLPVHGHTCEVQAQRKTGGESRLLLAVLSVRTPFPSLGPVSLGSLKLSQISVPPLWPDSHVGEVIIAL